MIPEEQITKAKILVIDDQKLHTFFLEKILKKEGYEHIECIMDSRKIIDTWNQFHPDLVLLDLVMPQIDGFQILEAFAKEREFNYVPVLALSEDKNPEIRLRALQAGATDFLTKPFESVEILTRIRNLIFARTLHLQVVNQNRILEAKVKERTKELNDTQLDIIRRLANAAECRDDDTGQHIIRMSQYCEKLAKALGLSDKQCELILYASPLHDIGKIGIPDSILLKPGKLTPQEYEVMKTHTTIGAKLLSGSSSAVMQMAEVIALTHHEKWDGTGYPRQLKGKNIPLVGQICSICDVFDALTSKRPYKTAWTVADAMTEIVKEQGKQFDSELVKMFKEILPSIEKTKRQNTDL